MLLDALQYVDNSDLLLRALKCQSTEEFIVHIQHLITFWGKRVLATGGVLKQKKSQVEITAFKFKSGKSIIKNPRELPDIKFHIPQKEGKLAIIPTISASDDITSLGFSNDLCNSG